MQSDKTTPPAANLANSLTAYTAAVLTVLWRVAPIPFNLVPVGGLAIFGGARLRGWRAYALPLAVMAVSDLLLLLKRGDHPFTPYVYASFLLYVLIGRSLCQTKSVLRVGAASVLGSVVFFLVTNFGAWLELSSATQNYYPRSLAGLMQAYVAGLSFFSTEPPPLGFMGNSLLADCASSLLIFGAAALVAKAVLANKQAVPDEPVLTAAD